MLIPSDGDRSGRSLGDEELALLREVVRSGTLNSTRGSQVAAFEDGFARWLGSAHATACASGSAAIHCCIQALGLEAGDEVITTPITDMGALTPILYEGGVPVFADVDPGTLNVTAESIAAQLTERTRAIIVTHLFGAPCAMDGILELASQRELPIIEDCAQAYGATWRGAKVGTLGAMAAFSLQQGKHITTGEGGIAVTGDAKVARKMFLAVNKAWGYGDERPDHYFPALNYRMTELQGAVANAQLGKLDQVIAARREVARALLRDLTDTAGLRLPAEPEPATHTFWKFAVSVDPTAIRGGAAALGEQLRQQGVHCAPHYIQKPAFQCALFQDWRKSPVTWMPLQHNPRRQGPMPPFAPADYPGAVRGLDEIVVLPINENYTADHITFITRTIRDATAALSDG